MPDLLSFLGGFQQPVNLTGDLLRGIASQFAQQKLHPTQEMGANRMVVPKGGAIGYYDAFGNFHMGMNTASQSGV